MGNNIVLKPLFNNLEPIEKEPEFKAEWNDADEKLVEDKIKDTFLSHTLTDHRGVRRTLRTTEQIEDFFGLPYTSSSSFAMVSNTNTQFYVDVEEQFNVEFFALTTDNQVVLNVGDRDENEKYFVLR